MTKKVLISIHPKWCDRIFSGKKTIEVRKTRPKLKPPFEVLVYETTASYRVGTGIFLYGIELYGTAKGTGKVIGSFVCNKILDLPCETTQPNWLKEKTLLTDGQYFNYLGHKDGYGWYITEPKLFDKPKHISEFGKCKTERVSRYGSDYLVFYPLKRAPQSWCYVEEI